MVAIGSDRTVGLLQQGTSYFYNVATFYWTLSTVITSSTDRLFFGFQTNGVSSSLHQQSSAISWKAWFQTATP